MNYKRIIKYIVSLTVIIVVMLSATIKSDEVIWSSLSDVDPSHWYGEAVLDMVSLGVIPADGECFYPNAPATRQDMILYLFNLAHIDKPYDDGYTDVPFVDVNREDRYYKPICWAYGSGIAKGYDDTTFNPEGQCTREELCTLVMRYLTKFGVKVKETGNADVFGDSLKISDYARSYVVAARLAGFVNGDDKGNFRPRDFVTRAELAKIVNQMYLSTTEAIAEGDKIVDTTFGAYDWYYPQYEAELIKLYHNAKVEWNPPVDLSYFDDAIFVGDSVSASLQFYCAASKDLGNAQFLCAGSLSPLNAHWEISDKSVHPVYKGEKLTVEEGVARSGASKVYIMLGINSLSFGLEDCVTDMVNLVDKILAKSPDVTIILQSVTPMTKTSPIKSAKLNNDIIKEYNSRMLDIAQERGWYYVNVEETVIDENGDLRSGYCSDPDSMGIHFNFEADKMWVNYLRTHVPQID